MSDLYQNLPGIVTNLNVFHKSCVFKSTLHQIKWYKRTTVHCIIFGVWPGADSKHINVSFYQDIYQIVQKCSIFQVYS